MLTNQQSVIIDIILPRFDSIQYFDFIVNVIKSRIREHDRLRDMTLIVHMFHTFYA